MSKNVKEMIMGDYKSLFEGHDDAEPEVQHLGDELVVVDHLLGVGVAVVDQVREIEPHEALGAQNQRSEEILVDR